MSVFRSYFSKNNTLIEGNETNNSQNPVTEISYGGLNAYVSRFIFNVDFEPLRERLAQGIITKDSIQKHILELTNTISYRSDLLGKKFIDGVTQRASSFELELFTIDEEWDEGSGYDFTYDDDYLFATRSASNWYERKTNVLWSTEGGFTSGSTVIGSQSFPKGQENVYIDITDIVNQVLFSGLTVQGFGLKFTDFYESGVTLNRQAVGFHIKKTNTMYEPFVLTYYDNLIEDDRNFFFLDKENSLFLYANTGGYSENVTVSNVQIIDYLGNEILTISGSSIENVSLGIYKINLTIDSDSYPDSVIFTDRWTIIQNGKQKQIDQEFYLISQDKYFNFNSSNRINFDNYHFNLHGIYSLEDIRKGDIKNIVIDVKQMYRNQDNNLPLNIEYRLFNSQSNKFQFDVIPWTKVNRLTDKYEFILDTSWLVPQDYFLEVRMNSGNLFQKKNLIKFTIISDGVTNANTY